jgi:hypothetical protein
MDTKKDHIELSEPTMPTLSESNSLGKDFRGWWSERDPFVLQQSLQNGFEVTPLTSLEN